MGKRKVWVEPLFAEAKQWHGMQRFRLRRLWRVNCEALLIASGQDLKRLLQQRGWGRRPFPAQAVALMLPQPREAELESRNRFRQRQRASIASLPLTSWTIAKTHVEVSMGPFPLVNVALCTSYSYVIFAYIYAFSLFAFRIGIYQFREPVVAFTDGLENINSCATIFQQAGAISCDKKDEDWGWKGLFITESRRNV